MFGPEVVWVNNFGLVRAVSALYALSTLSVLREAAGDQLSRYRSAARRMDILFGIHSFCRGTPLVRDSPTRRKRHV